MIDVSNPNASHHQPGTDWAIRCPQRVIQVIESELPLKILRAVTFYWSTFGDQYPTLCVSETPDYVGKASLAV